MPVNNGVDMEQRFSLKVSRQIYLTAQECMNAANHLKGHRSTEYVKLLYAINMTF